MTSGKMTRATFSAGKGEFEVGPVTIPERQPAEALLKVGYVGICGSDLRITAGDWPEPSGKTQGHELSAEVIEGPGELIGQHVIAKGDLFCGTCGACRAGLPTQCSALKCIGVNWDGAFSDFAVLPSQLLVPVPAELRLDTAALAEPLACVLYALKKLPERAVNERTALVLGGGPVGALFALVMERRDGAEVTVAEPNEFRRTFLGKRLQGEVVAAADLVARDHFPVVVETTGFLWDEAVRAAAPGGTILSFGLSEREKPSLQSAFTRKELSAVGSIRAYDTFVAAVDLLAGGMISVEDLVTHTYPLSGINAAFDTARSGRGMKVLIQPSAAMKES